jgi:hypothetical protein
MPEHTIHPTVQGAGRSSSAARPRVARVTRVGGLGSRWVAGMSLFLTALSVVWTAAADGRDFAGFCKLGEITGLGDEVSVPLTVRIHNYSGADVTSGEIVLENSLLPGAELARFPTIVDIPDGESAPASGTFTVPLPMYEEWQQGGTPQLRLEFTDAEGTPQRRPIELSLSRQLVGVEEE